jgi:hypothetical protein
MRWVTMLCLSALVAGCAATNGGSYCDIASPLYFDTDETVIWLSQHDRPLLRDIIIGNETWAALCDG